MTAHWPEVPAAVLVIHGIGEQHPFQTLDAFTAACWNVLEKLNGGPLLSGSHRIRSRDGWTENYISLTRSAQERAPIEFHEYYWAHKVQGIATLHDIVTWLIDTSEGARKFYEENEQLSKKYEGTGVTAFAKGRFRRHWYLKHLGLVMRLLSLFPAAVPIRISRILRPVLRWIEKRATDYVGDIVIYTSTDVKSKFHAVRQSILDGAVGEIRTLLDDPRCRRIVVAGHSLGSVIAFDALNRINHEMNVGIIRKEKGRKIAGMVTFGSPLDKIAFFFREHTPDQEYLRRQILMHYHGFKARPLTEQPNPRELSNPIVPLLEHVRWLNFWDVHDTISGQLDFYRVDENILLDMGKGIAGAHTAYWEEEKMYDKIIATFLSDERKQRNRTTKGG